MGPQVLLLAALLTLPAPPAPPPPKIDWNLSEVFTFHFENDTLGAGGDSLYTQGMELRLGTDRVTTWKLLPLARMWGVRKGDSFTDGGNLVIGHTIFTPNNLITYAPRADDRPFGAFAYVGAESVRLRNVNRYPSGGGVLKPRRLILGVTAGLIGPWAGGRQIQSAFHVLRENRMAKGWLVAQSPNRPQINLRLSNEHILFSSTRAYELAVQARNNSLDKKDTFLTKWGSFYDVTLMEEGVLGTTQTYAGFAATVRLGRGLTGLPGTTMSYRAVADDTRKAVEISLRAGGRVRGMLHNAFVRGPLGTSNGRDAEQFLKEWHVGGEVRVHEWRVSYLIITQGREIKNQNPLLPVKHRFGAVNISREGPAEGAPWGGFRKIAAGSRFNIRLGRAGTSITPAGPVDHKPSLAASWGFEHALPFWGLALAYEKMGATREAGPPLAGFHTDQFLLANAFTLGWEFPSRNSRHKVQLRAGAGKALAKYQVTPDTGSLFEPEDIVDHDETGKGLLAGLRWSFRVGAPISLTVDAAHSRLTINKAIVTRAKVTSVTVGVQLHPWHRDTGK